VTKPIEVFSQLEAQINASDEWQLIVSLGLHVFSSFTGVCVRDQVQAGASAADQKVGEAKKLFEIDLCVRVR
jgi:hypothetical protein